MQHGGLALWGSMDVSAKHPRGADAVLHSWVARGLRGGWGGTATQLSFRAEHTITVLMHMCAVVRVMGHVGVELPSALRALHGGVTGTRPPCPTRLLQVEPLQPTLVSFIKNTSKAAVRRKYT